MGLRVGLASLGAVGAVAAAIALSGACGFDGLGTGPDPSEGGTNADVGPSSIGEGGPGSEGGSTVEGGVIGLDGGALVQPSHVSVSIDPSAPDLAEVDKIDTTALTVTPRSGKTLPTGLRFIAAGNVAVLFVGSFTVNDDMDVKGDKPLVILASKIVMLNAQLDGSTNGDKPGPGGSLATVGLGAGGSAVPIATDDPGGGGAGFGTNGAGGGGGIAATPPDGGSMYGAPIASFLGGSGGGRGSPYGVPPCTTEGNGGPGGGAIQITSAVGIVVSTGGSIDTGGGGGKGGCLNGNESTMSGGGGGSGGTIFLEAPTILVHGKLTANGGGGGGGAQVSAPTKAGKDGSNGTKSLKAASGGDGSIPERNGGTGGARDLPPVQPDAGFNNAGGGGGAVGRIWLRTRAKAPDTSGSVISPAPLNPVDL